MTTPLLSQQQTDSWTRTTLVSVLLVVLGQLLQASDGHYTPEAIRWLALASAVGFLALSSPPLLSLERLGPVTPVAVLLLGLVLQFSQLFTQLPGMYLRPGSGWTAFLSALGAGAVLSGSVAFAGPRWARLGTSFLAVCFFAAGLWVLHASPRPVIDVFLFQQQASDALLHGRNPYALTFPNIYGNAQFYGSGVTDGRTLFFGFPYPPLSLFLAASGFVATGDHRSAQLLALVVVAACLFALRPDRLGALTAAVLLFTPRGFFVLEQGWTEPFGAGLLGLVLVAAMRAPKFVWLALGALFAWKQYSVVLLPLTPLLLPRPFHWRAWAQLVFPALLVTLILTLPLALWDLSAFWRSVVWLQTAQPFRADALSFPSALVAAGYTPPSVVPTLLVLTALAVVFALWKAPRTPQGFAAAVTLVLGVFFAFNKQSFCNYWFLVLAAAAFAVAAGRPPSLTADAAPLQR
jgi:hypothetical protein